MVLYYNIFTFILLALCPLSQALTPESIALLISKIKDPYGQVSGLISPGEDMKQSILNRLSELGMNEKDSVRLYEELSSPNLQKSGVIEYIRSCVWDNFDKKEVDSSSMAAIMTASLHRCVPGIQFVPPEPKNLTDTTTIVGYLNGLENSVSWDLNKLEGLLDKKGCTNGLFRKEFEMLIKDGVLRKENKESKAGFDALDDRREKKRVANRRAWAARLEKESRPPHP